MTPEVAAIAGKLSAAQRRVVLMIGDEVVEARKIPARTGNSLYRRGIISQIHAVGHRFTSLTEHGLAVRAHLSGEPAR